MVYLFHILSAYPSLKNEDNYIHLLALQVVNENIPFREVNPSQKGIFFWDMRVAHFLL